MTNVRLPSLIDGVRSGKRRALARAITLVESTLPSDRLLAEKLLHALLPNTGRAIRVGISGVPGAGKSTFIDVLGCQLIEGGHKVAVLAVDPSSPAGGGALLGDKTRMGELANQAGAFVRPSPSGGTLGGVASASREALLLCEAAGYDVVLVETVGVGQSEVAVASMTDVFVLLTITGAGDELQGIKRGVLELVDLLVVHKADGGNKQAADQAAVAYRSALSLLRGQQADIPARVCTASSLGRDGLQEVWGQVIELHGQRQASGTLAQQRQEQSVMWLHDAVRSEVLQHLARAAKATGSLEQAEKRVRQDAGLPSALARQLVESLLSQGPAEEPL